jgi:hypothetical protein
MKREQCPNVIATSGRTEIPNHSCRGAYSPVTFVDVREARSDPYIYICNVSTQGTKRVAEDGGRAHHTNRSRLGRSRRSNSRHGELLAPQISTLDGKQRRSLTGSGGDLRYRRRERGTNMLTPSFVLKVKCYVEYSAPRRKIMDSKIIIIIIFATCNEHWR